MASSVTVRVDFVVRRRRRVTSSVNSVLLKIIQFFSSNLLGSTHISQVQAGFLLEKAAEVEFGPKLAQHRGKRKSLNFFFKISNDTSEVWFGYYPFHNS